MSIESAKAFLERVKNDEDLLMKLSDAHEVEERLNIAKTEGFEFTKEEMFQVQSELGDDELAGELLGLPVNYELTALMKFGEPGEEEGYTRDKNPGRPGRRPEFSWLHKNRFQR